MIFPLYQHNLFWFCSISAMWVFIDGKILCEILTAADTMLLPMTRPRVDDNLFRHSSVRPSLQWSGGRTWG